MAVAPHPPHPHAVFKVLKNARRKYLASGNAIVVTIPTIPTTAHTAAIVVSGTITPAKGVKLPTSVTVELWNNGVLKATQTAPVDPVTGAFTTTFPANTAAAGVGYAHVFSTSPAGTATSASFTIT
jgi:hypothetical protein